MIDLDEEQARMEAMLARRERMALGVTCTEMIELITRLRQAEKDAARYRWLRDDAKQEFINDTLPSTMWSQWDIVIDKAMQCSGDNK